MCRVSCFHVSRECVKKLNRHCGSGSGQGVVHVQATDGNGYRDWLFYQNVFPQRESTSLMSFNGKEFTIEGLFRSLFTEL